MMIFSKCIFTTIFFGSAFSSVIPNLISEKRTTNSASASTCLNGPSTRFCWDGTYSIDTDSELSWPITGVIVPYTLVITNETLAPDGTPRWILAINGTYPGPTITANWGDTLEITVINDMKTDGVSMHWHGIVQKNTNAMDGVNGVTECPIPPGSSKTYKFLATQHGTSWYHSHHAAQYGDGILGSIVINGPAALDYDYDLGPLPITDFYYKSSYELGLYSVQNGPPTADNGLINGTNMNAAHTTGQYNTVSGLIPGAKYRLRIINTSVDNHFRVTLDSHTFSVIETDFVPIQPYTTDSLFIAIGQRYDVIITMDQNPDNYWFRAIIPKPPTTEASGCGANANNGSINAIFNYQGVEVHDPKSICHDVPQSCLDETNLVPWNEKSIPKDQFVWPVAQEMIVTGPNKPPVSPVPYTWSINNTFMKVEWDTPTLQYVQEGNTSYNQHQNIIELSGNSKTWTFWIIINDAQIPHPIHLHGHDFYLLGSKPNTKFPSTSQAKEYLNFDNPPRRDVAMLPAGGYLVIGFVLDNPGAWLLHCHIAWHVGEGLAVQFLERKDDILGEVDLSGVQPGCEAWRSWYDGVRTDEPWNTEFDSGI